MFAERRAGVDVPVELAHRLRWSAGMITPTPRLSFIVLFTFAGSALLAGSALVGCGGSDSISIDELPGALGQRVCARAVACRGAESQTACESTLFLAEDSGFQTVVAAVKRGTVKYDGASARACLDAITTDCADLVEPPACDATFEGNVPAGGTCVISAECVGGGRCLEPDTCTVSCCVGTCEAVAAPAAIGGACDVLASKPCVDGAFCANDGTCTASRPVGAACSGSRDECVAPAKCLYRSDGSETCTIISTAPGAACDPGSNFGCGREDETCNPTTSTCTQRALPGAACEGYGDCVGYATCDTASGTCKPSPKLGEPCDNNNGVFCVGGLICPNGVCAAPTAGTACVP
jgi:hypothetical protein